jgi:O-acetyl-ADP-ribose deacetylase
MEIINFFRLQVLIIACSTFMGYTMENTAFINQINTLPNRAQALNYCKAISRNIRSVFNHTVVKNNPQLFNLLQQFNDYSSENQQNIITNLDQGNVNPTPTSSSSSSSSSSNTPSSFSTTTNSITPTSSRIATTTPIPTATPTASSASSTASTSTSTITTNPTPTASTTHSSSSTTTSSSTQATIQNQIVINGTSITLVQGDITQQFQNYPNQTKQTAAIVSAANTNLRGGNGVIDGAIHRAAGPALLQELAYLYPNGCNVGDARLSDGHNLAPVRIIHAVGPRNENAEILRTTYTNILTTAQQHGITRIAIPAISVGLLGYDVVHATPIALAAIQQYLINNRNAFAEIHLIAWNPQEFQAMERAFQAFLQSRISTATPSTRGITATTADATSNRAPSSSSSSSSSSSTQTQPQRGTSNTSAPTQSHELDLRCVQTANGKLNIYVYHEGRWIGEQTQCCALRDDEDFKVGNQIGVLPCGHLISEAGALGLYQAADPYSTQPDQLRCPLCRNQFFYTNIQYKQIPQPVHTAAAQPTSAKPPINGGVAHTTNHVSSSSQPQAQPQPQENDLSWKGDKLAVFSQGRWLEGANNGECPICMEQYGTPEHTTVAVPACGHALCQACYNALQEKECPICRAAIPNPIIKNVPAKPVVQQPATSSSSSSSSSSRSSSSSSSSSSLQPQQHGPQLAAPQSLQNNRQLLCCYFNALYQCLMQVPQFAQHITGQYGVNAYRNLRHQVMTTLGPNQQDALAALEALPDLPNPNIYTMHFKTYDICQECHLAGAPRQNPMTTLSLPMANNQENLINRINTFIGTEEENIKRMCLNCNHNTLHNRVYAMNGAGPEVFMVHLRCFNNNGNKIQVATPFTLENLPFGTQQYRLVGCCMHGGTAQEGHYIAFVRNNNQWYKCDDSSISPINNNAMIQVANSGQSVTATSSRRNRRQQQVYYYPYMFFYVRE